MYVVNYTADGVSKSIMGGLGEMLVCKEAVILINKNTYISNWYFYRMLEVGFVQVRLVRLSSKI